MKKLKAILFYLFAGYVLPLIGKPVSFCTGR